MVSPEHKEFDPEDPMELVGVEIPGGDCDQVLEDLVQEYLFMGWKPAEILFLFRSPQYAATHQIYRLKGHQYVKERIDQLAELWNQGWINQGRIKGPALSRSKGGEPGA